MESTQRGRGAISESRILGLDPGGTTGICKYHVYTRTMHQAQLNTGEHHTHLWNLLSYWKPDRIVCERFDYRPKQFNADLSAVEYIGVIKLWCVRNFIPLVMQPQIKDTKNSVWTNTKLSALGIYKPGMPHAMDATRQILHYLTSQGEHYWVNEYGKTLQ